MSGGVSGPAPLAVVGFVGLGNIGRPMCLSVARGGFPVVAYDASPRARDGFRGTEVVVAGSLAEVGRAAGVCVLSLPNSDVVEEVVFGEDGLLGGLSEGDVVIDTSSSRPSSTRDVARRLAERGIGMLDAPVSGGVLRAETGDLAVMVGGEVRVFEDHRAVLEAFSNRVFYVGESGTGHMAKALNNLLSATTMASAAEAVLLGERAGLNPEKLIEVINASSGRSASTEVKFPRYVLDRSFDDGFAIGLMNKDVGIALDTASELGFHTVVGSAVGRVWRSAVEEGFGGEGHTAIYAFLEEYAGKRTEGEGS